MLLRVFWVVLVLAVLAAGSALAAAPEPVVGTWRWGPYPVVVKPTTVPGTFTGELVGPLTVHATTTDCKLGAGFAVWSLTGGGTSYSGTFQLVGDDCTTPVPSKATFKVTEEGRSLSLCTWSAQSSQPYCQTLERVGPPPAQPTTAKPKATPVPASRGIEGTWLTPIGVVRIVKLGATYLAGTVVKPSAETRCKNAVGERVWTFSGSGGRYEGTASVWDSRKAACTPATATATWVVKGDKVSFVTHSRADTITSSSTLVRTG